MIEMNVKTQPKKIYFDGSNCNKTSLDWLIFNKKDSRLENEKSDNYHENVENMYNEKKFE